MRKFGTLIFLLLLISSPNGARNEFQNRRVDLKSVHNIQKNDTLYLEMELRAEKTHIASNELLILTPVVTNGYYDKEFPSIRLAGKKRYVSETKASKTHQGLIKSVKITDTEPQWIPYEGCIEFESWMREAHIFIRQERYTMNSYNLSVRNDTISEVQLTVGNLSEEERRDIEFRKTYTRPKKNLSHQTFSWRFLPGQSEIRTDYSSNPHTCKEMDRHAYWFQEIEGILIEGYTSPDDYPGNNEHLIRERTRIFKEFLVHKYNYEPEKISIRYFGPDWEGLARRIQDSNIPDKEKILKILASDASAAQKRIELKRLKSGSVYKTLQCDFFPELERVKFTVYSYFMVIQLQE